MVHPRHRRHPRHGRPPAPPCPGTGTATGQMPITPPVPATSCACSGVISRVNGRGRVVSDVWDSTSGLVRHRRGAPHQLDRAVRHVHHDPARIAAADHLRPHIGQPAMHRRLGLDVAQFVDPVVRQLQMPQLPAVIRLIHPVRVCPPGSLPLPPTPPPTAGWPGAARIPAALVMIGRPCSCASRCSRAKPRCERRTARPAPGRGTGGCGRRSSPGASARRHDGEAGDGQPALPHRLRRAA